MSAAELSLNRLLYICLLYAIRILSRYGTAYCERECTSLPSTSRLIHTQCVYQLLIQHLTSPHLLFIRGVVSHFFFIHCSSSFFIDRAVLPPSHTHTATTMTIIRTFTLLAFIAFALCSFTLVAAAKKGQKVLLRDVEAITLTANEYTSGRRSSPVPQMRCISGPCAYAPTTMMCQNVGFDGSDVLWKCKADLEKGVRLGSVNVNCEGYDNPEDPYILRGSCGAEYTLVGEADIDRDRRTNRNQYGQRQYRSAYSDREEGGGGFFMMLVVGVLLYFLYKACFSGGGGGGGGGGSGSPPSYPGGGYPGGGVGSGSGFPPGGATMGDPSCAPSFSAAAPAPAQGPGFWSGMAAGGAMGWLFGRRGNYTRTYGNSYWSSGSGSGYGSSWSSGSGSSSDRRSSSSYGTSSSSAFGGTSRR